MYINFTWKFKPELSLGMTSLLWLREPNYNSVSCKRAWGALGVLQFVSLKFDILVTEF